MGRKGKIPNSCSAIVVIVIILLTSPAFPKYSGGSGTPEDPYQIANFADLMTLANDANDYNKCFIMTANIDLDPNIPGRQSYTEAVLNGSFEGFFDGKNHTISNLTIDTEGAGTDYLGLFRYVGPNAEVNNLGIVNCHISGGTASDYLGGLCGSNYGNIEKCSVTGFISGNTWIGGLCGISRNVISNSTTDCNVTGVNYLGGICGENQDSIENCSADGSVNGEDLIGGLCGYNRYDGSINNSFANCIVSGDAYIGGLCGLNETCPISKSHFGGIVIGHRSLGGICGQNSGGSITNCYSAGSINGDSSSYELGGAVGYNRNSGSIVNCYSAGTINGGENSSKLGALCGDNYSATISNCYFYLFSGPDNGLGGVLAESQPGKERFVGFDFAGDPNDGTEDYWTIVSGHCPKLTWQTDDGPLIPSAPTTTLSGGGYSDDPLQINDEADLTEFITNNNLNVGYYVLTTDIDLSGDIFATAVINRHFNGHFNGGSHVISNITIDAEGADTDYLGLFSYLDSIAQVTELGVVDCNVTGGDDSDYVGGLCGRNYGSISNCYSTGSIRGGNSSNFVGGLIGYNDGSISKCYSIGITSGYENVGGLCGYNSAGSIINCYAASLINGESYVGGLCGYNYNGSVTNCYAAGSVNNSDSYFIGALCGRKNSGSISNSYFYLFSGPDNGLGTLLEEPQPGKERFIGFDFAGDPNDGTDDDWTIVSGHCPKLTWQTDDGPLIPAPPVTTLSGSGYPDDPFLINSESDFIEFYSNNNLTSGYYSLTTGIDLSGQTFTSAVIDRIFGGHFEGNNNTINNLIIDTNGASIDYLGLFGKIHGATEINNLGIIDCNIIGGEESSYVGGLCGMNYGSINNCYSTGFVSGYSGVGGLIGVGSGISYSFSKCTVSGQTDVGGFCGENGGGIDGCYATGAILGSDNASSIGGFCGVNFGTISNCYAIGDVHAGNDSSNIGGFCGENTSTETIINCYSTGTVTAGANSSDIGGLCGDNTYGTVITSYWDVDTSGQTTSAGGTGLTTEQMKTYSYFADAGWDFNDVWHICETTNYPKLLWQVPIADFLCPDGVTFIDYSFLASHWLQTEYGDCNGLEITGDGKIDLREFAILANYWRQVGCGDCGGIDYSGEGNIDSADLVILCENWLFADYGDVEGAEITGDGLVNFEDLDAFVENWLQ
jgi:hypothetical protein